MNTPTVKLPSVSDSLAGTTVVTDQHTIGVDENGFVSGIDVPVEDSALTLSAVRAFDRIGESVRVNIDQIEKNLALARKESDQFFKWTIVFAAVGFIVVVVAVGFLLTGHVEAGVVSSVAATIPEVTAVLFFRKDKELRATINAYHQHLHQTERLLTMIDVAETIADDKERDRIKQDIIYKALNIDLSLRKKAAK